MKKIICLLGKSCAGKDTAVLKVQEMLEKEKNINNVFRLHTKKTFKKAISYTTRPKRENEIDGIDYHFVSLEKFEEIRKTVGFIEETYYKVNDEVWHYGFSKDEFDENTTYIMVANPRGLEAFLHSNLKKYIEPILLDCNLDERKKRYFQRDKSNNSLEKQWEARVKQDEEDFKDVFNLLIKFKCFSMLDTKTLTKEEVADYIIGLL